MSAILLSGPPVEPISLDEAKAYLRVEIDDDDDLIGALVVAARVHVEARTRRALIAQSWRLTRDCWPSAGRIAVLPAPLQSLTAVRIYNADGTTQTVATDLFVADRTAKPGILSFAVAAMPAPGRAAAGIEIDVAVGYGANPTDVPEALRQAIRLLTAHWYENRALVVLGQGTAVLPETVAALIAPYRVLSL